jgi:hypothetical protein
MPFSDFLKDYETQTVTPQTGVSQDSFGRGAVAQNTNLERLQVKEKAAVNKGVSQLAMEEATTKEATKQADMQRSNNMVQLSQQQRQQKQAFEQGTKQVIDDTRQNMSMLSQQDKEDQMNIAAAQIRLRNDKYVTELQMTGNMKRLDDANQFDTSLKEAVFDDEINMVRDNFAFKKMLDADDATFMRMLGKIDISTALDIAKSNATSANKSAAIEGFGTVAAKGAGAYYAKKEPDATTEE